MQRQSLDKRLLLAAAAILAVFMLLTGSALQRAFVENMMNAREEKLHSNILLLLAAAESDAAGFTMPNIFPKGRFNLIGSGLYGFIFDRQGRALWRSPSALLLEDIPGMNVFNKLPVGARQFGTVTKDMDQFFYAAMGVDWEVDPGSSGLFTFAVIESAESYTTELQTFQATLWTWLGLAGALLLVTQVAVLRWSLRPLSELTRDVSRVESGELTRLEGDYPAELFGLAKNLNHLLEHEQLQRERFKNKLNDLAHSLKTPLAVASGAISADALNIATVEEQLQRMDNIVQYQLQRAVVSLPQVGRNAVLLKPLIEKLLNAMAKVYADKALEIDCQLDAHAAFYGDESDAYEVSGNLIENAFKYCHSRVRISLTSHSKRECSLCIEDDGPGIKDTDRARVLERGHRLDMRSPGQGIGLAVVEDILADYKAELKISVSRLGGALFEVRFQQA